MKLKSVGYKALIDRFGIDSLPNWHYSFISIDTHTHKKEIKNKIVYEIYPKKYAINDSVMEHLEFALKYDGVNLVLLSLIFDKIEEQEIIEFIKAKPTGKYIRRIWYFYEFLTNKTLPIEDLKQGNYVDLLEENRYYTLPNPISIKRQRVRDNMLGDRAFCPIVRKTATLKKFDSLDLSKKSKEVLTKYPASILKRALSYLYTKETKSSFEIERVKPPSSRVEKFIALLKEANSDDFCTKEQLIKLQNRIVDSRFRANNYRISQNYVGESLSFEEEKIHYISPRPEDLEELMNGLIHAHNKMTNCSNLAVVHASTIAYGFVYLHPFEDGNGRIHRFLLHNILALENFTPKEMIFSISALLLKNPQDYDASLEYFSTPLLSLIDYKLNEIGEMSVLNDTALFYRYIDMTKQTEVIYEFISKTVEEELINELEFMAKYNASKMAIQNIVDMPDRLIELFIKFTYQNSGKLSKNKREKYFAFLTDKEIEQMQRVILI